MGGWNQKDGRWELGMIGGRWDMYSQSWWAVGGWPQYTWDLPPKQVGDRGLNPYHTLSPDSQQI